MRSKRVDRKQLKSEILSLRAELERLTADTSAAVQPAEPPPAADAAVQSDAPKIAACGYPLRSQPQKPKSLKEAKELLMSLRDW